MVSTVTERLCLPVHSGLEAIANNPTAREIYAHQELLSVLNEESSQRRNRFYEVVVQTPLRFVDDDLLPADLRGSGYIIAVKDEGRQKGGAYKLRGTTNALLDGDRSNRVVVASTGNHANETAIAGRELGYAGTEVHCPRDIAASKRVAMQFNGAEVYAKYRTLEQALGAATGRGKQDGYMFVHPYNDLAVIAGQGTISLEAIAQLQAAGLSEAHATFILPAGGGGIGAGNAVAAKANWPNAEVRLSQMEGAHGIAAELYGYPFDPQKLNKACDGAAVASGGRLPMEIIKDNALVDAVDVVSEADIGEAMAILAQVSDVPEPAGALALAAALQYMRLNKRHMTDGGQHVLVAVTSGRRVTPQKVGHFMQTAFVGQRISGPLAASVMSKAYAERNVDGLDEYLDRHTTTVKKTVGRLVVR